MSQQKSINPHTGELLKTFKTHTKEEIDALLAKSDTEFRRWKNKDFAFRAELMQRAADELKTRKAYYARLISLEMGKVISEALSEIEKCAWVCEFYAEKAEEFLKPKPIELPEGKKAKLIYQPLGCIMAIMPWNFPFWQVFRFAAPTLMAGNSAVLKHASNVPQCALAIQDVFERAGFPQGLFQTLLISGKEASELIKNPIIQAVSLTGSEGAGAAAASTAGSVIKKSLLELGGSDAFIVLKDANLDRAVSEAVKSRMVNFGQSCIAAKRFIIEESIFEEFQSRLLAKVKSLKKGDPLDETSDFACMARADLAEELYEQLQSTLDSGAKLLWGGKEPKSNSAEFEPTVLSLVPTTSVGAKEELFGPVFCLFRVKDAKEAVKLANSSEFGLGGSVWSKDEKLALQVAEEVETGAMFINSMVASNPYLPFGGIKKSGYGRELGANGIHEFVNAKSIYLG
ncbi:NAD-dependent succinate-semialdehyde dehydrogenase [Algoriphagus namhaensis]